ncbi:MAG: flagellar protein [Selenomonadaceae bacterium]|nr:flagellar protein [Selenomonadaceae bacterium]
MIMAGKIKNCQYCGKLYAEIGRGMCPDCLAKEDKKIEEVVTFVRANPGAKVPEIVKETGAHETLIKRLIREGRFEQMGVKMTYPCEKCGAPIITGKLCQNCSDAIKQELQATQEKAMKAKSIMKEKAAAKPRGQGMHSKF